MNPVKTIQKYKCDFCRRRSTKSSMEKHEKICFRNPNRFCDYCKNDGKTEEFEEGIGHYVLDCPYCSRFDKKQLKEIEQRESKKEVVLKESEDIPISEIPF